MEESVFGDVMLELVQIRVAKGAAWPRRKLQ
jgi:hypothetical protein